VVRLSNRPGILSVLALLAAAMLLLGPAPAQAAKTNCGSGTFTGHLWGVRHNNSSGYVSGAQANIDLKQNNLCNPPSGYIAAVQAYAELAQVGGGGYAWLGWQHDSVSGSTKHIYAQYSQTGSAIYQITIGTISSGTTKKYKTTWQNGSGSDGFMHFIMCNSDGTGCVDYGHTNFNPGSAWSDSRGVITGVTDTQDADMPGITGDRNNFDSMLFRDGTGAWNTLSTSVCKLSGGSCSDSVSWYHPNDVSNSKFQLWTDPVNR